MSEPADAPTFPEPIHARLFDAHPDAHWLIDGHGRLRHANRAALRLMGQAPPVPVGRPLGELLADGPSRCADLLHQGLRATGPSPIRLRVRTGAGGEVACRGEIALLVPASEAGAALLWCRLLPHGLGNDHFEVLNQQIEALRREVGRRQAAEQELRQQSEWLETVLLGITEGVIATDLQGQVLFQNQVAADMTGCPRALALGHPVTALVRWAGADAPVNALVTRTRGAAAAEPPRRARIVARDGTERAVEVKAAPLMSEAGVHCGSVIVLRAIDGELRAERERQTLEAQLRESQKMEALGTLAGGVAHDFNNIIAAILGNVELALADTPPEARSAVSLQEVRKAGRRARDLVQQILTFSRRQDDARALTQVGALLQEAQGFLRTALPPEAALSLSIAPRLPAVWANATQIEQVLINLITNALQALPPRAGGQVRVGLRRCEGTPPPPQPGDIEVMAPDTGWSAAGVLIEIADNGSGMPPEVLGRIFEPFFTTKATGHGTGLGLAVVHGILREHGALLRVRSTPGAGTTFTVALPGVPGTDTAPEEGAAAGAPAAAAPRAATSPVHVLYVDDDESMTFLVQRFLERHGYRVTTCDSPEQALQRLDADDTGFTLCITDFNMPGMSGLNLARAIKARRPDLPVAIASGYISDDLRAQAPQAGVDALLYKPDTVEELCRGIERLLQGERSA